MIWSVWGRKWPYGRSQNLGLNCWNFWDLFWAVSGRLRTVVGQCVIIDAINYGLGVFGSEMAMDFGSTKWNRCLVRGLSKDSPLLI